MDGSPLGIGTRRTLDCPDCEQGLTEEQALERKEQGLANGEPPTRTKSVRQILRDNFLTPFNLLNLILGGLIFIAGSYKNMLFLGVAVCNTLIGTFQELQAKRTIDRLSLIASPLARVVRGGQGREIPVHELVLGDVCVLESGNQICADSVILRGSCEVNESLITGESEPVEKREGDLLLSGSFLVSGTVRARVEHVGEENYAASIVKSVKRPKRAVSEILTSVNRIIRFIGIALVPIGVLMFVKQVFFSGQDFRHGLVATVGALVGMVPEGLVLLTSVVLAVSVLRLARHKALVQDLYSIETLARVDVLCLDKTGTLTEGSMQADGFVPLAEVPEEELRAACAALAAVSAGGRPTLAAMREGCGEAPGWQAEQVVPFSSSRKWSGASFAGRGSYVLGAAEFILRGSFSEVLDRIAPYAETGSRVLLLAHAEAPFGEKELPASLRPLGLVLLSDKIRENAAETLRYFAEQGVTLKVISGDSPATAASVAGKAGFPDASRFADASLLSDDELRAAAEDYAVFGRVTPEQKLLLVRELQSRGHTVAMTGDGANDVMALRESDCSVAMAEGSDAARAVSNVVLLDSDFANMPRVVREGRRSINNLQRSAALFLVKSIFSGVIAVCFLFFSVAYPFEPIQFTLINAVTIGIPSFFLALEPNKERIRGRFITNVLRGSLPGAAAMIGGVLLLVAVSPLLGLDQRQLSTMAVCQTAFAGFLTLVKISLPYNAPRAVLTGTMAAGFVGAAVLFPELFSLSPLTLPMALALPPLLLFAAAVFVLVHRLLARGYGGRLLCRLRALRERLFR